MPGKVRFAPGEVGGLWKTGWFRVTRTVDWGTQRLGCLPDVRIGDTGLKPRGVWREALIWESRPPCRRYR